MQHTKMKFTVLLKYILKDHKKKRLCNKEWVNAKPVKFKSPNFKLLQPHLGKKITIKIGGIQSCKNPQ